MNLEEAGMGTSSGPALLGKDHQGKAHLLLPLEPIEDFQPDESSRGVVLVEQSLQSPSGELSAHADLVCVDPTLIPVFTLLVDDVLDRVRAGGANLQSVQTALADWRALLRRASGPQISEVIGLRGELHVLALLAESAPRAAVEAWTGPLGGIHDFQSDAVQIEVKTTLAHQGAVVEVHGLDQLAPSGNRLLLSFIRLTEDSRGESVTDLVDRTRSLGVPADLLMERLERLAFDPDGAPWRRPFMVADHRWWDVVPGFPGIHRGALAPAQLRGVLSVAYSLDLDAAGEPLGRPALGDAFAALLRGGS